jgi:hypothetical protein
MLSIVTRSIGTILGTVTNCYCSGSNSSDNTAAYSPESLELKRLLPARFANFNQHLDMPVANTRYMAN